MSKLCHLRRGCEPHGTLLTSRRRAKSGSLFCEAGDRTGGLRRRADVLPRARPGLAEHDCAAGVPGGFGSRMRGGPTWFGHVTEHVCIMLNRQIGRDVSFGRTVASPDRTTWSSSARSTSHPTPPCPPRCCRPQWTWCSPWSRCAGCWPSGQERGPVRAGTPAGAGPGRSRCDGWPAQRAGHPHVVLVADAPLGKLLKKAANRYPLCRGLQRSIAPLNRNSQCDHSMRNFV